MWFPSSIFSQASAMLAVLALVQVLVTGTDVKRADGAQEVLAAHNAARAKHGAAPLTWDSKLASYAAAHAKSCQFQHTNGPYGENLAAGTGLSYKGAVDMWMAEAPSYESSAGFSSGSGHFTQVVWKGSKRLGCARITTCAGAQLGMGRRRWRDDHHHGSSGWGSHGSDEGTQDGSDDSDSVDGGSDEGQADPGAECDDGDDDQDQGSSDGLSSTDDQQRVAPAWRVAGHVGGEPKKHAKPHRKHKSHQHKDHQHKAHKYKHHSKGHTHKGHDHKSPADANAPGSNTRDLVDAQDGKARWLGFDGVYYLPEGTYPDLDIGESDVGGAAPAPSQGAEAPGGAGGNTDGSGYAMIMCEYDPPGNVMGEFAQNVQ